MRTSPAESSNIGGVGYDAESMTLEVVFVNGGRYRYGNVEPAEAAPLLLAAPTCGQGSRRRGRAPSRPSRSGPRERLRELSLRRRCRPHWGRRGRHRRGGWHRRDERRGRQHRCRRRTRRRVLLGTATTTTAARSRGRARGARRRSSRRRRGSRRRVRGRGWRRGRGPAMRVADVLPHAADGRRRDLRRGGRRRYVPVTPCGEQGHRRDHECEAQEPIRVSRPLHPYSPLQIVTRRAPAATPPTNPTTATAAALGLMRARSQTRCAPVNLSRRAEQSPCGREPYFGTRHPRCTGSASARRKRA